MQLINKKKSILQIKHLEYMQMSSKNAIYAKKTNQMSDEKIPQPLKKGRQKLTVTKVIHQTKYKRLRIEVSQTNTNINLFNF